MSFADAGHLALIFPRCRLHQGQFLFTCSFCAHLTFTTCVEIVNRNRFWPLKGDDTAVFCYKKRGRPFLFGGFCSQLSFISMCAEVFKDPTRSSSRSANIESRTPVYGLFVRKKAEKQTVESCEWGLGNSEYALYTFVNYAIVYANICHFTHPD
jgi:hypothetical protein